MINFNNIFEKDLQNIEIQTNLMKDIEIEGTPLKAFVANAGLDVVFNFGGHDFEGQKIFKIPRYLLGSNDITPPGENDLLTYQGQDYAVRRLPPDMSAPLLVYTAICI